MKFLMPCILIIILPVLIFTENTLADADDIQMNADDTVAGQHLSDVLFIQYRGVFRDLLSRRCVYYPSCSHYGQEAIESKGAVFGLMMALERWTRCSSAAFSHGDYTNYSGYGLADPVNPGEEVTCWGRFLLPF